MEHRYYTLDVFTNTRFAGNPLAVFTDGDGLSDDQMLAIAREMNLSETVFVQKPTDEEALARLRIFTTREELKLAGHRDVVPACRAWGCSGTGRRRTRFAANRRGSFACRDSFQGRPPAPRHDDAEGGAFQ